MCSLDGNSLGGHSDNYRFVFDKSGILKLAEVLPDSQLMSLRSDKTDSNTE